MHETSTDNGESERESDDECLAKAYQQLLKESEKMAKHNKNLRKRLLELEDENNRLKNAFKALEEEKEHVLKNNNVLQEKLDQSEMTIKSHQEKIGFPEQQYKVIHTSNQVLTNHVHQLKSDIQKFSSGSKKLEHILGLGQTDKLELGYERTYIKKVKSSTSKFSTRLRVD